LNLAEDCDDLVFEMSIFTYEDTNRPVLSCEIALTFLATIMQFSRELVGQELTPKKFTLKFPKPDHDTQYINDYFNCEVEFDSDISSIVFNAEDAETELVGSNPLITQVHEQMLDDFLLRIDKDDLVHVIRNKIYQLLPLGYPSQTEIAKQMCMSLRSLQRKLQEEDTSYKEILEYSRKKLTMEYIKQPHLSLSEIGYLVGFSSVGNFNRAFKRWTNTSPGKYRNHYLNSGLSVTD